jgi:hypothetical protein
MDKINQHAALLKFTQKTVDTKADQVDVTSLKAQVVALEAECDEVRQRGMKGNLIITSPNRADCASRAVQQTKPDRTTGAMRKETEAEMCVRMIHDKTGVEVPLQDIVACHALNGRGADTSYIIRIANMKPGSAWDILAAAILTGKNKVTKVNKVNVFINFQLTKRRGELMQLARKAKVDKRIVKYGADQNGRITVKVKVDSRFEEVTCGLDLQRIISNPTPNQANHFRQHRG